MYSFFMKKFIILSFKFVLVSLYIHMNDETTTRITNFSANDDYYVHLMVWRITAPWWGDTVEREMTNECHFFLLLDLHEIWIKFIGKLNQSVELICQNYFF